MTSKMKRFVEGLLLELCKPFPKKKEPIGYLYGHIAKEGETATHTIGGVDYVGVVLPDIYKFYTPELQKQYPYAVIGFRLNMVRLFCWESMPKTYNNDAFGNVSTDTDKIPAIWCFLVYPDDTYKLGEFVYVDYWNWGIKRTYWSNFDIFFEDGTVAIAAIDPIPIYE